MNLFPLRRDVLRWCIWFVLLVAGILTTFSDHLYLAWTVCISTLFAYFYWGTALSWSFTVVPVMTLSGLAARHFIRPHPPRWIKFASTSALALAVGTPFVPLAGLYALSWRGAVLLGHWPRFMYDDPQFIGGGKDPLFEALGLVLILTFVFAGWGIVTWLGLMLHLRSHLSFRRRLLYIVLFFLAWLAFAWEPGGRLEWRLD